MYTFRFGSARPCSSKTCAVNRQGQDDTGVTGRCLAQAMCNGVYPKTVNYVN